MRALYKTNQEIDIHITHGLRTPNEGINQRYLKNWADVTDKICFGRTNKFRIGIEFRPCSEGYFLSGRP